MDTGLQSLAPGSGFAMLGRLVGPPRSKGFPVRGESELRRDGVGRLSAAIPPSLLPWLRAEAVELRGSAERVETDAYELYAGGQDFRSPVRFHISEHGDALQQLHEHEELRELASALAGTRMLPTKAGYLHYEEGDRIGLHTDLPACQLVLLAALGAQAPPLVVHPELRGLEPQRLKELAVRTQGTPSGGTDIALDDTAVVGLFGGGLPHQTRPVPSGSEGVVVTLCYAAP